MIEHLLEFLVFGHPPGSKLLQKGQKAGVPGAVNYSENPDGAILVFLPGLMEITNLFDQLRSNTRDLPAVRPPRRPPDSPACSAWIAALCKPERGQTHAPPHRLLAAVASTITAFHMKYSA